METRIKQITKKYFLAIALFVIFLGNTVAVSQNQIDLYERARDAAIILIMIALFSYCLFCIFKKKESFWEYLVMANIALATAVIHLLRLNFNGLLC